MDNDFCGLNPGAVRSYLRFASAETRKLIFAGLGWVVIGCKKQNFLVYRVLTRRWD